MEYPVYRFKVKKDGTGTGMVGISLVDEPAMESSWEVFKNEQLKPMFIALESTEEKQELLGAALIPDKAILRKDEAGNYYYGVFDGDTIETIRNKFHKEKKNLGTVNLNHDSDKKIEAYLNESYIIQTQEQLDAVHSLGLGEEVVLGSWVVRYKIEDSEVFNFAKENLTGFSIEILLERELVDEFIKSNFKNNFIMSKVEKLVERFKSAIEEFETPGTSTEQTLEDVTVAESGRVLRYTEVGEPVLEVTTDEEGNEETVPFQEAAELILEDGRTIVIDENGNLVEIKEAEEDVDPVAEEDMEEKTEGEKSEEKLEDEKPEDLEDEASEQNSEKSDLDKTIREVIPTNADGTYQLEVYVSEGKISFGTLYAYTYKDMKFDKLVEEFESLKQEKESLNSEVENLKAEVKKPIAAPVFTQFNGEDGKPKMSKEVFKNNLEYTLHRLGLDKD